jgi:hypothetical protein
MFSNFNFNIQDIQDIQILSDYKNIQIDNTEESENVDLHS